MWLLLIPIVFIISACSPQPKPENRHIQARFQATINNRPYLFEQSKTGFLVGQYRSSILIDGSLPQRPFQEDKKQWHKLSEKDFKETYGLVYVQGEQEIPLKISSFTYKKNFFGCYHVPFGKTLRATQREKSNLLLEDLGFVKKHFFNQHSIFNRANMYRNSEYLYCKPIQFN